MKLSLIMLTAIGMMHFSAEAQRKSNTTQNFKVCRINGVYRTCSDNTPSVINTRDYIQSTSNKNERTVDGLRKYDTYTHMQALTPVEVKAIKNRPLYYDERYEGTSAAYNGNPTPENDGIEKNKERNTNYLNSSVDLPANDGSNSKK